MKQQYISPEMEIVMLEQRGMLCLSTLINGEATEPASCPEAEFEDGFDWE